MSINVKYGYSKSKDLFTLFIESPIELLTEDAIGGILVSIAQQLNQGEVDAPADIQESNPGTPRQNHEGQAPETVQDEDADNYCGAI